MSQVESESRQGTRQFQGQSRQGQQNGNSQSQNEQVVSTTWEDMNQPGAYVDDLGDLFRVPIEALRAGGRAGTGISRVSYQQRTLTRVSSNPYVALSQAREIAANCDIEPQF